MDKQSKQASIDISCIAESLEVVYTAFCNGCGAEINNNIHEDEFAKQLYEKGWRVSETGDLHCPPCDKKYSK